MDPVSEVVSYRKDRISLERMHDQMVALENRVKALEHENKSLKMHNQMVALENRVKALEHENKSLKMREQHDRVKNENRESHQHSSSSVLVDKLAPPWRIAFAMGASLSTFLSTVGLILNDDWWAAVANCFWIFSGICVGSVVTSNPRNFHEERPIIVLVTLLVGIPGILSGWQLYNSMEQGVEVQTMGIVAFVGGVFFILLGPPASLAVVKLLGELSDRRLHKFIMGLFRSLPSTLGATLYVSAEAGRCIIQAEDGVPILQQCGNPLAPTFFVAIFLGTTWVITTVIPFIQPPRDLKWSSIAQLSMKLHESSHLGLMITFSALTVVMYAFVYEDGDVITGPLYCLGVLFMLVFVVLVALVTFESVVMPCLNGKLSLSSESDLTESRESTRSRKETEIGKRGRVDSDAFSWGVNNSGNSSQNII